MAIASCVSTAPYPIRQAACGSDNPVRDPSASPRLPISASSSPSDLRAQLDRREAQIRSLCLWLEAQRKELDYLIAQLKECC